MSVIGSAALTIATLANTTAIGIILYRMGKRDRRG